METTKQLPLFSAVLHAYAKQEDGVLDNATLHRVAAEAAGVSPEEVDRKQPIGQAGQHHSVFKRKVRWYQQNLRSAGILERVQDERGLWRLTNPAAKDLSRIDDKTAVVGFSTELGIAIIGSCDSVFARVDAPIVLVLTSPPYPLAKARKYGNPTEAQYVDWIVRTLEPVVRNLVPGGSICLNISNDVFLPGVPARSLYAERVLIALHDKCGLTLVDRMIWKSSKPPGPYQWCSRTAQVLATAYEPIFWMTNDPTKLRSNNRRVLQAHTEKHLDLIKNGGEQREGVFSDGAYRIKRGSFGNMTEGTIPKNVLEYGARCGAQSAYKAAARATGLPAHGAPMPLKLASFLVEFLSEPGDLIADPFGGSFTTADAAERLGRRWLSTECMVEYVQGAASRFRNAPGFQNFLANVGLRRAGEQMEFAA